MRHGLRHTYHLRLESITCSYTIQSAHTTIIDPIQLLGNLRKGKERIEISREIQDLDRPFGLESGKKRTRDPFHRIDLSGVDEKRESYISSFDISGVMERLLSLMGLGWGIGGLVF